MSHEKISQSLANLEKALMRLEEALNIENPSQIEIDGSIQRFEFTLELYWKTLKRLLANEGIEVRTPKETLKAAFKIEWLHNETAWLEMLNDCNQTSYVYDQAMTLKIYQHIKANFPELKQVFTELNTSWQQKS